MDILDVRLRAEAGDPAAQLALGQLHLLGRGVPRAPEEAMRWVRASCAQKFPNALLHHAVLATLGLDRPRSFDDAIQLLATAAAQGDGRAKGQLAALGGVNGFNAELWTSPPQTVQHCDAPRIFTMEKLIPKAACDWLIEQARARQTGAAVLDAVNGGYAVNSIRTGTMGNFTRLHPDIVLQLVQLRISGVTGIPLMHQEDTVVLRYEVGQRYLAHYDFIDPKHAHVATNELRDWGQRVGTLLIYLNDGYEGGETEFTNLNWRYKGNPGDAILFWNVSAGGQLEFNSRHAGLPVQRGEKWLLSKWMRARPLPLT